MLKAIKENVKAARGRRSIATRLVFLPADRLEQVFQEKFPQALENLSEQLDNYL